jgi:4-carboxymuconolactone decarboxylase
MLGLGMVSTWPWTQAEIVVEHRDALRTQPRCELADHVRGGINNGLSKVEIQEALLQVVIYVGMPVGLEGFRIAEKVLAEIEEKVQSS